MEADRTSCAQRRDGAIASTPATQLSSVSPVRRAKSASSLVVAHSNRVLLIEMPSKATWTGFSHSGHTTDAASTLHWKTSQKKMSCACVASFSRISFGRTPIARRSTGASAGT